MTRYIELDVSKDAYTSTDWRKRALPDEGDYSDPMPTWRRLGMSRQFTARFRCTEPCTLTVIAAEYEGS